jgi:hypothetical protein
MKGDDHDDSASPENPSPVRNDLERRNALFPVVEDPESFLGAYGDAFVTGKISILSALHATDFQYTTDGLCEAYASCEELPWLRNTELRALGNMMDLDYPGTIVIQERRFHFVIFESEAQQDGSWQVSASLVYVLLGEDGGYSQEAYADLVLREGQHGLELQSFHEEYAGRAVPTCWAALKCLYLE